MTRNKVLKFGVLTVMAVIVGRLFFIQILQHEMWTEKAAAQQTLTNTLPAERGEIYMMDGSEPTAVVLNATVYTVIVDPMLADQEAVAEVVGKAVGDKLVAEWEEVFANRNLRYYVVARGVEWAAAEQIAEAELTGVWLQSDTERVYPEGTLASTVLGFVNAEGEGQYGVEGALDERLAGTDGLLKTVKDVNNIALSIGDENVRIPAEDGENMVLTLDKNLQHRVEQTLASESGRLGFANLSAVVLDPNTGEVLAMADYPGYDPANYGQVTDISAYISHVVEDPYEPASVCKTFTFATGMEYGVMDANTTFNNEAVTYVDDWPIWNAERGAFLLGQQTIQTAFNYSLNTGSTQVLRWLGDSETEITAQGRERLYEYYHNRFGLGEYTGIELYEALGSVTEPNAEIYGINSTYANMTFGQNMQVTMIQVAAAFASVVNGGHYYTPTVVAGTMEDGEFVEAAAREPVRETVSEETSAKMREMLYNTRKAWRNTGLDAAGYYVGGKTGTAQVIRDGAYVLDETVATYIGFGGTEGEMPEYVIMVRVWEDGKVAGGQEHALPVFNALKTAVQDELKVRPAGM